MRIARTVGELRALLAPARRRGSLLGLVPTMGALHDGHLSLLRSARADCDVVVMSLFVNPAQFRPGEDLEGYPRDEARDRSLARAEGVDVVFAPDPGAVYPPGYQTTVELSELGRVLEGDDAGRGPSHLRGVATVVTKLFNMVAPDVAYFGQKDAQQTYVIRRLVRDLDMPVRIEVLPTVREPDGLALSSRNAYLSPAERERAAALPQALRAGEALAAAGERDPSEVLAAAGAVLSAAGIEPEYLVLRSAADLSPIERIEAPALLLLAARIGRTRLIDNTLLGVPEATAASPAEREEAPA